MNDRTCTEEEQRFEESVGTGRWKVAAVMVPKADGHDHVAKLAHGRECEHALDVVVDERHAGCKDGSKATDEGDDFHGQGGAGEERKLTSQEINTGGDHGRCVDQRTDWCRTFHGVWQPYVQWERGIYRSAR